MSSINARARRVVAILIIPQAVLCLAAACSQHRGNNSEPTPVISGPPSTTFPMPPLSSNASAELGWTLADGKRATIAEQRGKVVVLDLYATWCEPCRQSIPHLISLHERYQEKGLVLVGLNVGGPDDRVKVPDFAAQLRISYPLGFPDKSLTDLLLSDNNRIPQTFVFDRDGLLVKRYIGYDESIPGQLEQLIQSALVANPK
ncbi:MAG TPA: TlpA disulfide reductase family protein [Pyrinomonadaceae bacterium]|nr:TlpA disulfide reductase family protein [Pyrinomonadaceae bacterium]